MIAIMKSFTTMAEKTAQVGAGLFEGDWQERLASLVDAMREMSLQTEPGELVRAYGARMRALMPATRVLSLSRRGLVSPRYRITR
jgi:sigma-B regulation protein RsbU (phosphoserine phosphatase)